MEEAYSETTKGERQPLTPTDEDDIYQQVLTGKSARAVALWFAAKNYWRRSISHTMVLKITRRLRAEQAETGLAVDQPDLAGKSDEDQLDDAILRLRRIQLQALAETRQRWHAIQITLRALEMEIRTLRFKIEHAARERVRQARVEAQTPKLETTAVEFPPAVSEPKSHENQVGQEVSSEVSSEFPPVAVHLPRLDLPKVPGPVGRPVPTSGPALLRAVVRDVKRDLDERLGDDYMSTERVQELLVAMSPKPRQEALAARDRKKQTKHAGARR